MVDAFTTAPLRGPAWPAPLEAFLVFGESLPKGVIADQVEALDLVVQECHKVD